MQNFFIKIRCFMEKIIFSCCLVCISMTRAFRCQYALENKVCIPTSGAWRWYTVPSVYRLLARVLTYRADGISTSGAVGKFPQSVYRLLASKELTWNIWPWKSRSRSWSTTFAMVPFDGNIRIHKSLLRHFFSWFSLSEILSFAIFDLEN